MAYTEDENGTPVLILSIKQEDDQLAPVAFAIYGGRNMRNIDLSNNFTSEMGFRILSKPIEFNRNSIESLGKIRKKSTVCLDNMQTYVYCFYVKSNSGDINLTSLNKDTGFTIWDPSPPSYSPSSSLKVVQDFPATGSSSLVLIRNNNTSYFNGSTAFVMYLTPGFGENINLANYFNSSTGFVIGFLKAESNSPFISVSFAGIFNGYNTLAISQPRFTLDEPPFAGVVYFIYAVPNPTKLDLTFNFPKDRGFTIYGPKSGSNFGISLAYLKNFYQVGHNALAIGAGSNSPVIYFLTSTDNIDNINLATNQNIPGYALFQNISDNKSLGWTLASMPDPEAGSGSCLFFELNEMDHFGNSYTYFYIMKPQPDPPKPIPYLDLTYFSPDGSTSLSTHTPSGFSLYAPDCTATEIGDFNKDGKPDIAIGCTGGSPISIDNAPTIYVLYGGNKFKDSNPRTIVSNNEYGFAIVYRDETKINSTWKLGSAELDDGTPILVAARPDENIFNYLNAGVVFLIYGGQSRSNIELSKNLTKDIGCMFYGYGDFSYAGSSLVYLGKVRDLNTLCIGSPGTDYNGTIFCIYLRAVQKLHPLFPPNIASDIGFMISGDDPHFPVGKLMSITPNFPSKGAYSLLVVSFHIFVLGSDVLGSNINLDELIRLNKTITIQRYATDGATVSSISFAGTFNGYSSIAVSYSNANALNRPRAGIVYIIYGIPNFTSLNVADLTSDRGFAINGENEGDQLGSSLAYVPDFYKLGYNALAIGGTKRHNNQTIGAVYLIENKNNAHNLDLAFNSTDSDIRIHGKANYSITIFGSISDHNLFNLWNTASLIARVNETHIFVIKAESSIWGYILLILGLTLVLAVGGFVIYRQLKLRKDILPSQQEGSDLNSSFSMEDEIHSRKYSSARSQPKKKSVLVELVLIVSIVEFMAFDISL